MRPTLQTANERCLLQTVKKLDAERAENLDLRLELRAVHKQLAAAEATIAELRVAAKATAGGAGQK